MTADGFLRVELDRRKFLRRAVATSAVGLAAPLITPFSASPAFAASGDSGGPPGDGGAGGTGGATTYRSVVLADSPWLYWRFGDAVGSTSAGDVSGNGRPGTFIGRPTLGVNDSATVDGNDAYSFVGNTGDIGVRHLSFGDDVTGPLVFSLELWFRTTAANSGDSGTLLGLGTAGLDGYDREVILNTDGTVRFYVYPQGDLITSVATYDDGAWHHVVVTVDAAGGSGPANMYIDGVLINVWLPGGVEATPWAPGGPTYWRAGSGGSGAFAGYLDEVAIYDTDLTATDVAAHMTAAGVG